MKSTLTFEEGIRQLHKLLEQQASEESVSSSEVSDEPEFIPAAPIPMHSDKSVFRMTAAKAEDSEDDDEDVDFGESIISSQLVQVNLDKERRDQYVDFFYPRKAAMFLPVVDELVKLSARTNGFFALLRYCLANARILAMTDKQGRADLVNKEAERILKNVEAGSYKEIVGDYLDGISAGQSHVILPSARFKGGFDIQFIGAPASPSNPMSKLPTLNVPYGEYNVIAFTPSGKDEDSSYKYEYLEAYATELSQACVAAGEEVMQALVGNEATSYTSVAQRLVRTLPLTFDFSKINDIFFNHTGIVLTADFIGNISPDVTKHFGEFLSVNVLRTPKAFVMQQMLDRMRKAAYEAGEGEAPKSLAPNALENVLTKEGLALSQTVTYSFSISLPKDISDYITQTKEGERPSMLSLHNWASIWTRRHMRKKGSRMEGGRIKRSEMPKFVMPLSKAQRATELRVENSFHVEPGKGDEHNIYIAPNGSLQYGMPAASRDEVKENLEGYERDMEKYLEFCFEHGIPVQNSSVLPQEVIAAMGDSTLADQYKELHSTVQSYSGKLLSYDWDYNNIITANVSNPTSIVASDIVGAAKVDTLTLADYMGFNFAREGEEPIQKTFADSIVLMTNTSLDKSQTSGDVAGSSQEPSMFLAKTGMAHELLTVYTYFAMQGRVPAAQELVAEAARELNLDALGESDSRIHSGAVSADLRVLPPYSERPEAIGNFIKHALDGVMKHCAGGPFLRQEIANENEGASYGEIMELMEEHPNYFVPNKSPAVDFGRLYALLGGMVFKIAMQKLTEISPTELFSIEPPVMAGYAKLHKPNFSTVSKKILPLAVMFSKYIPNGEETLREAELYVESNTPDDSIDEESIRVSGGVEGAQMFPHQIKAHQSLRKRPKFSILDIAPGGGKTSLGVTDIGAMVTELSEIGGKNIRPIILCPDGLIKNWVDDMKIFTKNKWNMVPVNKHVISRWGYERLEELLKNAPVNTIVVCGFNFLTSRRETVVFGTHSARVSNNLEFMKRFEFDYICIDESHKLKNKNSLRHKTIKQLTTGSHVRYLRLATGTLINDRVTDIVGQASLSNGHIFREGEVSNISVNEALERRVTLNGEDVPVWEVDTPQRARQKLSRFASVITMKKKEWAFMLPSPIETFISVPMVPTGSNLSEEDIKLGEMHKQLYDAVLEESVEELEQLVKKARSRSPSEDSDDEESEENLELNENDELAVINDAELKPYLARIERLVTNPMADPLAPDIFGAAGVSEYHSTKAKFIAKRIDQHFNPEEWSKDKLYKEYTLIAHNGKLYLSRKLDKTSSKPVALPDSTRGVPPSQDTETWKEEPEGKVIIFCRYTNSVNGIYAALPERYKSIAVKFTGEEDDKWGNFDAFQNDPKIKVLVANEMGIAEGHNMQMASRIIRVESPWAPGDLDQASSRIFRPDPKAAKEMVKNGKPGELLREAVFLDWILCDGSMEVAKQARLIAKIFNKARFDEAENSTYNDVLSDYDLEEIPMSLDTLRSRATLEDFSEYVEAYAALNGIQREEFHDMRVTMDHTMKNLEPQPEVKGSRKVPTPFVSNQKPEDPNGWNLSSLRNMLRNESYSEYSEDPTKLEGMPVVTDLGNGRIAKVRVRYLKRAMLDADGAPVRSRSGIIRKEDVLDSFGKKVVDPDNPIVSFLVKQAGTNEILPSFSDTGVVYIPTKLDAKTAQKEFHVNNLRTTKTEERKAERQRQADNEAERKAQDAAAKKKEREEERELVKEERRRQKLKKEAEARRKASDDGKSRKKNLEAGQPINKGIKRVKNVPAIQKASEEDVSITLHPALYHGFLTLELRGDELDVSKLKKYGFKDTGPYAYVSVTRYNRFDKVLDYLEQHFDLSSASIGRLEQIQDAFDQGPKGIYRMELAPKADLPYFFATRKRKVTKRAEIRPYPIILPDELQIAVDVVTNPAIRKHIGRTVPGAVAKWQQSEGHMMFFAANKGELRSKATELKRAGFIIENFDEMKAEVTNIKFKASSGKKKAKK